MVFIHGYIGIGRAKSPNVKEHAPPLARASFGRGVRVEITEEHVNRAASGGCVSLIVRLLLFV